MSTSYRVLLLTPLHHTVLNHGLVQLWRAPRSAELQLRLQVYLISGVPRELRHDLQARRLTEADENHFVVAVVENASSMRAIAEK
jgi:hypothetical protein